MSENNNMGQGNGGTPFPGTQDVTQGGYPNGGQPGYPTSGQPYPNSGQGYPTSGQGYPTSGQGYPTSGQGYPGQPGYPNSGYPQSGQPYPNSGQGYPSSGYPQSGQFYPNSGYPVSGFEEEEKNSKKTRVALIAGIIALVAVLAIAIIVWSQSRPVGDNFIPNWEPPKPQDVISYAGYEEYERDANKLVIDGETITLPSKLLLIDNFHYASVQDFASIFGYDTVFDFMQRRTIVSKDDDMVAFYNGYKTAWIMKQSDTPVPNQPPMPPDIPEKYWNLLPTDSFELISEPIMFDTEKIYIPLRSLADVFHCKNVDWVDSTKTIEVTTDGKTTVVNSTVDESDLVVIGEPPAPPPGGGYGMPPPPGGNPFGGGYGAPPPPPGGYGAPPPGGYAAPAPAQPAQDQAAPESKDDGAKEPDAAPADAPSGQPGGPGGQPPGGQPGGPGGPPPS